MKYFLFIFILCSYGAISFAQQDTTAILTPDKAFENSLIISYQINRQNPNLRKYAQLMIHIREIAYRIAAQTEDERPFTFQIINDPSVNAFALPGGFIFITTGMLDLNLNDEEWAHLFGHELTHIVRNHHSRAQQKTLMQWPIILASIAATIYANYELNKQSSGLITNDARNRYNTEIANLYTVGFYGPVIASTLLSLQFTRELENEADMYGRKYAAMAGYGAKGAEELFQRLSKSDNPHVDHIWRSHPEMLSRAYAATLSDEKIANRDFTPETNAKEEAVQNRLYGYLLYYVSIRGKGRLYSGHKSQLNPNALLAEDHRLAYHLVYLHLAELIISINKNTNTARKTLSLIAEQLLVLDTYNASLAPWGKYAKLQAKIDPENKYAEIFKTKSQAQYESLTAALKSKRAGIPVCSSLVENFPEHPEKFLIYMSLLQALFQNKIFDDIPERFQYAITIAANENQKKELSDFGILYTKICTKPFQLTRLVLSFNDEPFTAAARNAYATIVEKCNDLHEIVRFLESTEANMTAEEIGKTKEKAIIKTFNRAKLKEKQKQKSEAALLYNEIILYGENSPYVDLAKSALKALDFE